MQPPSSGHASWSFRAHSKTSQDMNLRQALPGALAEPNQSLPIFSPDRASEQPGLAMGPFACVHQAKMADSQVRSELETSCRRRSQRKQRDRMLSLGPHKGPLLWLSLCKLGGERPMTQPSPWLTHDTKGWRIRRGQRPAIVGRTPGLDLDPKTWRNSQQSWALVSQPRIQL